MRGPVDASDFKTFIFPLLFFKRISDVYDEEYQQALQESEGDIAYAQFAENHRFVAPDGCHWRDVRATTTNVGQAIQRAMREIEKANPNTLYGIFGDAPWSNKDRLSDALLRDLVEHFSRVSLANRGIDDDILGQAYEYLIKKFADQTNRQGRGVLHAAQGGAADGQNPGPQGRRNHLRPDLWHCRYAPGGHSAR